MKTRVVEKISEWLFIIGVYSFGGFLWWIASSIVFMIFLPEFYEIWFLKIDSFIPYIGIVFSIGLMWLSGRVFDYYLKLEYPLT